MIEAIIDWMAENLSNRSNLKIIDTRYMDDLHLSDLELAETASRDAAACVACEEYSSDSNIPIGKQVL